MKKLVIFAVMVLMSITASAVEFSFAEVTKVAQEGNGFKAYAGDEAVAISALQYTQMRNATGYYILSVDGEKVVAAGDEFSVEKLTADSVGLDGTQPKVFFTNGTARTFTKSEWLKTLKGQTIRRIYINIPTWEFENFATVAEGQVVVYHDPVAPVKAQAQTPAPVQTPAKVEAPAPAPVQTPAKVEAPKAETKVEAPKAPAKVEAPKAETKVEAPKAPAKVEAKAKASDAKSDSLPTKVDKKAPAPAPTKVEAPAQSANNGNIKGITFKITH